MIRLRGILPLLLLLLILSCKKNDSTNESECVVYPLKKGNTWNYKTSFFNPNGSLDSSRTGTTRLTSTLSINNNIYYTLDSFYYPIRNKDCNTLALYDANSSKEFEIKNNSTTNNLEVYDLPFGTGSQQCRGVKVLVNKDRTVINNYDCFKVEYRFTSCSGEFYRRRYYYINEKVGMVLSEAYRISGEKETLADREELLNFKLQ